MKQPMKLTRFYLPSMLLASVLVSGCAPLWFAGGAATGVAVANDAEDGEILD